MTDYRIYVACLASYNNGALYGRWIDCEGKNSDDIQSEVNIMLKGSKYPNVSRRQCQDCNHIQDDRGEEDSCDICGGSISPAFPSAEEWAIHDHEGFSNMIGEYTSFDDIAAITSALSGDHAVGFAYLVDNLNMSPSEAVSQADEVSYFEGSAREYAESLIDDCYSDSLETMPDILKSNIDYDGIAHDLKCGGDICRFEYEGTSYLITNANGF